MEKQQLERRIQQAYESYKDEKTECTVRQLNSLQMEYQETFKSWYFPPEMAHNGVYANGVPEPAYDGRNPEV